MYVIVISIFHFKFLTHDHQYHSPIGYDVDVVDLLLFLFFQHRYEELKSKGCNMIGMYSLLSLCIMMWNSNIETIVLCVVYTRTLDTTLYKYADTNYNIEHDIDTINNLRENEIIESSFGHHTMSVLLRNLRCSTEAQLPWVCPHTRQSEHHSIGCFKDILLHLHRLTYLNPYFFVTDWSSISITICWDYPNRSSCGPTAVAAGEPTWEDEPVALAKSALRPRGSFLFDPVDQTPGFILSFFSFSCSPAMLTSNEKTTKSVNKSSNQI